MGSLLVGAGFAKGMKLSLNIPILDIHHMKSSRNGTFIDEPKPEFPFFMSHCIRRVIQIVKVKDYNEMEVLEF